MSEQIDHPLKRMVTMQKKGMSAGICSICSAHPIVLEAAIEKGLEDNSYVLIEATANQVNQYGGYTGLTPLTFAVQVKAIAARLGFPEERLILGGDHFGPLVWKNLSEEHAMARAKELVSDCVLAGFSKVHIDTSMRLTGDDPDMPLACERIAARAAVLFETAQRAWETAGLSMPPVYVIGSEVPVPGGTSCTEDLEVTSAGELERTYTCFREAFMKVYPQAFSQVVAIVAQPGVEFGEGYIHDYAPDSARALCDCAKRLPLVLEGHSTDYQTRESLKELVRGGVAILKVGPALTFALREGLLLLEHIEKELPPRRMTSSLSQFSAVLDRVMCEKPEFWRSYYRGSEDEERFLRKFSLSDRCRYYLPDHAVEDAARRLLQNLNHAGIPLELISQYFPIQYEKIRTNTLEPNAMSLLKDRVKTCLDAYPKFTWKENTVYITT